MPDPLCVEALALWINHPMTTTKPSNTGSDPFSLAMIGAGEAMQSPGIHKPHNLNIAAEIEDDGMP